MQTVYKLNADELNTEFLDSIKALFPHKVIEVAIQEVDDEYKDPANVAVQRAKFAQFPARLKITRDEMHDRRPEYRTMKVDEIVMPSRDERYDP